MNFEKNTRGFRNNNPGNIRQTQIEWQGEEGDEAVDDDPAFEEFVCVEDGIRAIGVILNTYYRRYELRTVDELISRYAPAHENETAKYAAFVADVIGYVGPSEPIKPDVWPFWMPRIVIAIVHMENGFQPFSEPFIKACLSR